MSRRRGGAGQLRGGWAGADGGPGGGLRAPRGRVSRRKGGRAEGGKRQGARGWGRRRVVGRSAGSGLLWKIDQVT